MKFIHIHNLLLLEQGFWMDTYWAKGYSSRGHFCANIIQSILVLKVHPHTSIPYIRWGWINALYNNSKICVVQCSKAWTKYLLLSELFYSPFWYVPSMSICSPTNDAISTFSKLPPAITCHNVKFGEIIAVSICIGFLLTHIIATKINYFKDSPNYT